MINDFEIGRVVAVDTAQVTIELNKDIRALSRNTFEGVQEVGRINSYIIIPVGAQRLVAIITRVVITEEAELNINRTMVTLPASRRIMRATLVGTVDGNTFNQGVSLFPILDNPVLLPSKQDLDIIFDQKNVVSVDLTKPGYCIPIGQSVLFKDRKIHINPDIFFGKHAAILGSTDSGKSCTIASLLQSILARKEIKRTTFILLDTNGEYQTAFQQKKENGDWEDAVGKRCLYIPTESGNRSNRLVIPYWFLNSEDYVRLFQARKGVQRPVLLEALRLAKCPSQPQGEIFELRQILLKELHRLLSRSQMTGNISVEVEDIAEGCYRYVESRIEDVKLLLGTYTDGLKNALKEIASNSRRHVGEPDGRRFPKPLPLDIQQQIRVSIQHFINFLIGNNESDSPKAVSADSPLYFSKEAFKSDYIEKAIRSEETESAKARDYCGTMLMRIYRILEDPRFEFMFGNAGVDWPNPLHSLATFLRDIIGLASGEIGLSEEDDVAPNIFPYYDRQRNSAGHNHVVILDLSLLASEALENVTALIGRLILEFLQRMGEYCGDDLRGSLPVVLVLEEAQNYIREGRYAEEDTISRDVFERIAREGRKYGLSLVLSSQRPSELSKTVLSQCGSFIVHRLQNPEDLRYFKDIVPGVYEGLMDQLPALAPQSALILGECVRAPALVKIKDASPLPHSRNPKFYRYWVSDVAPKIPVEEICCQWELGKWDDRDSNNIED
ncbi:MAG: DUF87 domain-containing protein [Firmicutes bacterium]|nr:DUF87 domain-containing protein [Bacillota bacterium]